MNTVLLLGLFLMQSANEYTLSGPFLKPGVFWEDLNQDGATDIWVLERTGHLWIKDGMSEASDFVHLEFEPLNGREKPLWLEDRWVVTTFFEDSDLVYISPAGWQTLLHYANLPGFRKGMAPVNIGSQRLVPMLDGYWLMEGPCVANQFKITPAVTLNKNTLKVTYPIPQWTDLDNDGQADVFGAPVSYQRQGLLGVWVGLRKDQNWVEHTSKLQISPELEIQQFQIGDINGDTYQDLVVIARPSKDLSVFEELSFLVYLAEDHGKWNPRAIQTLKTRQNLWQTGPMEVNAQGIFIYYYKGLIRSKFKMDRYVWNPAGYIEPNPISEKWKIKDADRGFINLTYDFNQDGQKDLLLEGDDGLQIFYRQSVGAKGLPFSENNRSQFSRQRFRLGSSETTISIGSDATPLDIAPENQKMRLSQEKHAVLIRHEEGYRFWSFQIGDMGQMTLSCEPAAIH